MERQIGKGEFFQEELTSLNKTGWRWGLVRKRKISRMNSGISAFKEPFNTEGKPRRPANSEVENK